MEIKICVTIWILQVCNVQYTLANEGYFWHVTDFHYDTTYDGARLSCDSENTPRNIGQFGTYWCDSPWLLINSSVQAMARIKPDVDFLLWTGDSVLHGKNENLSYTLNAGILDATTGILKQAFPGTSVYASFGNHDYFPNNQFPPYNNQLYNDTLVRWTDWINDSSQTNNFLKGGFYTVKTQYGLRIIALNTNLYYTSNKAAKDEADPAGQFAWLNQTLDNAVTAGEKVLVTAHIPPGIHTPNSALWMYEQFNIKLVNILQQHTSNIVGMHFGHDHADGFKVLLDRNGHPGAPIFIAPSVTPWKYIPNAPDHNPGIRLVRYDRQTGKHLEIYQYYLDIIEANEKGIADWKEEYNSSSAYGVEELTASSLFRLQDRMADRDGVEFQNYWTFTQVSPRSQGTCDEVCHATIICGFKHFDHNGLNTCKDGLISGGVSLSPVICLVALVICHMFM